MWCVVYKWCVSTWPFFSTACGVLSANVDSDSKKFHRWGVLMCYLYIICRNSWKLMFDFYSIYTSVMSLQRLCLVYALLHCMFSVWMFANWLNGWKIRFEVYNFHTLVVALQFLFLVHTLLRYMFSELKIKMNAYHCTRVRVNTAKQGWKYLVIKNKVFMSQLVDCFLKLHIMFITHVITPSLLFPHIILYMSFSVDIFIQFWYN